MAKSACVNCGKGRSVRKFDGVTTTYCITCAETQHPEWYAAYHRATRCQHCSKNKRVKDQYDGITTKYCISCAKMQHPEWHAAYLRAMRCIHCNKNQRIKDQYDGITTKYCVTCAETQHPEWYAGYLRSTRCIHCRKNKRPTDRHDGITTKYCVTCAETQHSEWHAAYLRARQCVHCRKKHRATSLYDGITTTYCVSCAETQHPEWHAGYIRATRCMHCNKNQRNHSRFDGVSTKYCVSCAETHHPEWYQAYSEAHYCLDHGENQCFTYGSSTLDGYCARCFLRRYPDSPRIRWVRCKELAVLRHLIESFPEWTWVANKTVHYGCSRRRPDALVDFGTHVLVVEIDEHAHRGYSCESRRVMEISQDIGHRPLVIVRFNPDGGGCWRLTPVTKEPVVRASHAELWQEHLAELNEAVAEAVRDVPDRTLTQRALFY